jgi:hypothetical protein
MKVMFGDQQRIVQLFVQRTRKGETKMNKCPFGRFNKHEECAFYRKGVRVMEATGEQKPFEECAINIIADCMENLVSRQIGLQAEMNKVRNEAETTNKLFQFLAQKKVEIDEDKRINS